MATTLRRAGPAGGGTRRRGRRLTRRDKLVLGLMVGVPTLLHVALVWVPTVASVALSFARWDGIGGFDTIKWIGLLNYRQIFTIYPPFWPAIQHNVIWFAVLLLATGAGLFFAVLLDKQLKFTRLYQSALYLPVALSLAIVGFIWQLVYSPEDGLLNNLLGRTQPGHLIDWFGNPRINLWARPPPSTGPTSGRRSPGWCSPPSSPSTWSSW